MKGLSPKLVFTGPGNFPPPRPTETPKERAPNLRAQPGAPKPQRVGSTLELYGVKDQKAPTDQNLLPLPLGRLKGLLHKIWKDVAGQDLHAVLKDLNKWVADIWSPGKLKISKAQDFTLDFTLDLSETSKWRGQLVSVDFHLELHLEQTTPEASNLNAEAIPEETSAEAAPPPVESPETPPPVEAPKNTLEAAPREQIEAEVRNTSKEQNRLRLLSPQVADTGNYQIAWQTPFRLEIFDKQSALRLRVEEGRGFQFAYKFQAVQLRLLDHSVIRWQAPENLEIQKGLAQLKLAPPAEG